MSEVVEHLEKILADLTGNRSRLIEKIAIDKMQLEMNELQVQHFDTLIATARTALGDSALIAKIKESRTEPPAPGIIHGESVTGVG